GLLVRQCSDRDLAEEITQQTFVKLVSQLGKTADASKDEANAGGYQEQGKFEAWLFRIAVNALRDEMRRRGRHARPIGMSDADGDDGEIGPWRASTASRSDVGEPWEQLTRQEQIMQLQQAMETLGDADREILHLRHTA